MLASWLELQGVEHSAMSINDAGNLSARFSNSKSLTLLPKTTELRENPQISSSPFFPACAENDPAELEYYIGSDHSSHQQPQTQSRWSLDGQPMTIQSHKLAGINLPTVTSMFVPPNNRWPSKPYWALNRSFTSLSSVWQLCHNKNLTFTSIPIIIPLGQRIVEFYHTHQDENMNLHHKDANSEHPHEQHHDYTRAVTKRHNQAPFCT